ncbi:ligase-associated DNA damage response endonuclease PdeM [Mucilaginibacter pallidiroseus]|uniref:Ligase-associated DNA damage response endonuclease PdeM n=1 Tax=Mucilaginibacter pallidiroseus TaxID=2599295 RepID=A0A563UFA3_9SPHI|nr:ligase-associated DNA damage response endonuclease PdeM [Mucilaginibacter pallidiroseus]TWR30060.1 ligase-associated DNA damage response endonuclease PdeM [Mucilaginibacter pallidiroseus]
MSAGTPFNFLDQDLLLLPQKAIYWHQQNALILTDVHFGKVGHFRKAGIAIPRNMEQDDLAMLSDLVYEHKPEKLIFLGDLFHSDMNNDWDWFVLWRSQFPQLEIILIKGNHDIIADEHYTTLGVILYKKLVMGPFVMLHHPLADTTQAHAEGYVLCGHIHPGVHMVGRGRQSITLPCFAFAQNQAILPSFGRFTGRVAIVSRKTDHVFGVLKDRVIAIA